ncbi:phosphoribosylaminoimidazole-succinocarboxamide synthase [Metarhizium guizhouense ARSEF 977]|uniref:Phosphoribosylaminoimidazole-succinocarboxamide synthase n=1 Tax=Metarhizium guizhouense (strain ARSEF 977) TaxID=1276136 RepID=A0A0B4H6Q3_METGA|nr:phosphoribosylaminoimidazole-succinocarboxamide synthase [Metarhizium guizhouense ARSEF 977]
MAGTSPAVDGLVNPELTQRRREAASEEGHGSPEGPNLGSRPNNRSTEEIEADRVPDDDGRSRDSSSKYIEPVESEEAVKLGYPSLNFRFLILADWMLVLTLIIWLLVLGGVITLTVLQMTDPSRLHIRVESNYYALRYGPSIVGLFSTNWWRAITQGYNRLIPYAVMANVRLKAGSKDRNEAIVAHRLNNADANTMDVRLIPELWKSRHLTTLAVNLLSVNILILTPLKTSFLQLTKDSTGWGVEVSPTVGWIIVACYAALSGATLAIMIRLHGKVTGLKWSPCSLAAQIALLQFSDVPRLETCEGLEFDTRRLVVERMKAWTRDFGVLRLGYWRDVRDPSKLFYCIRFFKSDEGPPPGPLERQMRARIRRADTQLYRYALRDQDYAESEVPVAHFTESQINFLERHPKPLSYFRYWFLFPTFFFSDWFIIPVWTVLLGTLATLSVTLGTRAVLLAHSYAGFARNSFVRSLVFSFLPSALFSSCNMVLLQSDTYHRMLQPIRAMDRPAPGRESVLLDYMSADPVTAIITACRRGHSRIAWGVLVALVCGVTPIVSGSIFTFDLTSQTFWASPTPTYAALGIACVYMLALPFARIDAKYVAGRGLWNIVDTLSLCYDSPILRCPEFATQGKRDDEDIHLQSQIIRQGRLYQFGYYLGDSGRRRLGFSVARLVPSRQGENGGPQTDPVTSEEYVARGNSSEPEPEPEPEPFDGVDRIKSRFGFFRFVLVWLREPAVILGATPDRMRQDDTEMNVVGGASSDGQEEERHEQAHPRTERA